MFEIAVTHGMLVEKKACNCLIGGGEKICYLPTLLQHFAKLVNKHLSRETSTVSPKNGNIYSVYTLIYQFGFISTLQQLQV